MTLAERISEAWYGRSHREAETGLAGRLASKLAREWSVLSSLNDPQDVYALMPFNLQLN
jgi:hypothetical protein